MLGLKAETPEEATNVLADAVMALGKDVGIDMNFQSFVPDEKLWESNLEKIAYLAYEDQCTPANPREPLVREMEQIMRDAYKGN
jgi:acetaldehyde dehydrogenase/alcohol dehydrogenase